MLKELIKLANELDKTGLVKEADFIDRIVKFASPMPKDHPGIGNAFPASPGWAGRRSGGSMTPLEEALKEYAILADNPLLNLYLGDDEATARDVIRMVNSAYSRDSSDRADAAIEAGEYKRPRRQDNLTDFQDQLQFATWDERSGGRSWTVAPEITPSDLIDVATRTERARNGDNKPFFEIIMTGIGPAHRVSLDNTKAKGAWIRFVQEHEKRVSTAVEHAAKEEASRHEDWMRRKRELHDAKEEAIDNALPKKETESSGTPIGQPEWG